MNGRRHINATGYHHALPGAQRDPLEASLACGMGVHSNWLLPISCMFALRESDILDNTVVIPRRMIDGFRRVDG